MLDIADISLEDIRHSEASDPLVQTLIRLVAASPDQVEVDSLEQHKHLGAALAKAEPLLIHPESFRVEGRFLRAAVLRYSITPDEPLAYESKHRIEEGVFVKPTKSIRREMPLKEIQKTRRIPMVYLVEDGGPADDIELFSKFGGQDVRSDEPEMRKVPTRFIDHPLREIHAQCVCPLLV